MCVVCCNVVMDKPNHWQMAIILSIMLWSAYQGLASSEQMPTHLRSALPEPRAYIPDAQNLDFVYHNHEDMTRFLR